ncbi:MAG: zinc ribbon domain-containing protein [Peptococcaceae bacterium]|nr:zinc ribbon domain-containing protein [Peptococcaceae bacterium]
MDFIKKVTEGARTISEGAKTIGKKSGELVESAKLKFEVAKHEKEMENNIAALGKLVYMQYKGEKGLEDEIERLLISTRAIENDIAEMQEQIARLHPKPPVCPKCQTELPVGARYCFNCGSKVAGDDSAE